MTALDPSHARLRDHFIGWQCRIRQHAMRTEGGRPPPGARARVEDESGSVLGEVTLIIVKREPRDDTAQFRHMASRTNDPAERYSKALEFLASAYYQQAREFSDDLCALYPADSVTAAQLLGAGRCVLVFSQFQQTYRLPCMVTEAARDQPVWQAAYWHNALFNPRIPPDPRIVLFKPCWLEAAAEPPPH